MADIKDVKDAAKGVTDVTQETVKGVSDTAKGVASGATVHAKRATAWVDDFKQFISRGNVVQLAVGVSLGAAFNAIVASGVNDILIPVIGALLGGVDFKSLSITVGNAVIAYGKFIQAVLNFVIVALVLFWVIRLMNRFWRKQEASPAPPPADVLLLTEIRDLLKGPQPAS